MLNSIRSVDRLPRKSGVANVSVSILKDLHAGMRVAKCGQKAKRRMWQSTKNRETDRRRWAVESVMPKIVASPRYSMILEEVTGELLGRLSVTPTGGQVFAARGMNGCRWDAHSVRVGAMPNPGRWFLTGSTPVQQDRSNTPSLSCCKNLSQSPP